ncbi:MAG: flagellar assembly protein FliW [Treponemataceae bacterium]
MEIDTKSMGKVTIDKKQLIDFPCGLFGFEQMTEFALIESEHQPFLWLQSVQESGLAFLIMDPFLFCADYELDVDDEFLQKIEITNPADILVLSILTVPSDGSGITANLQGPVIINKKNNKGLQVVVNDPRWQTKYNLFDEMKKRGGSC